MKSTRVMRDECVTTPTDPCAMGLRESTTPTLTPKTPSRLRGQAKASVGLWASLCLLTLMGCEDQTTATLDPEVMTRARVADAMPPPPGADADVIPILDGTLTRRPPESPDADEPAPEPDGAPVDMPEEMPEEPAQDEANAVPGEIDVIDANTPANAADRFDGLPVRVDCRPPRLTYPEEGTIFPRNIIGIDFQWTGRGEALYQLQMRAGDLRVNWFTVARHLIPDGPEFDSLKAQASQGVPLEVKLLRLDANQGIACASPTLSVEIDQATLLGAVYYWSTGDTGIMRLAAGSTEPEPFLTPEVAPNINCPACHALSRDGTKIAFTRTTMPPMGDLAASDVDDPTRLTYDADGVAGAFPSFAPDNERIVATWRGRLLIRSASTGQELLRLPTPPRLLAGAPDWSWQGGRIVGTLGRAGVDNMMPDVAITGEIAIWTEIGNRWSRPEVLVPQGPEGRNDRPSFSPDGSLVAFNRVGNQPVAGNMSNPDAELWVVDSEGGDPVRLGRANGGQMQGNNWPKWAPQGDPRRLWLAFSSTRRYGGRNGDRPQIWVTAIDLDADRGEDPSAPAFWMPYQDPTSGNHIPYWAVYEKR